MHVPVMLHEVLGYLEVAPEGVYLDVTAGLGGHTVAIAQHVETGRVIAIDRDAESLEVARRSATRWSDRIDFRHGKFSELSSMALGQVDGLLADLGASRYQLTEPERGFSLMSEGPLDMRMDRGQSMTAADLVNFTAEEALADLIYRLGEERRARKIVRAIVRARPIYGTVKLTSVVEKAAPRTGRLHPATKTFMALRMAVNQELEELDALLDAAPKLVKRGGRIVIITFMSLEDRKVKHCFQSLARDGRAVILTRHVVRPTEEEVKRNPPSRSAKLRALEMK